MIALAKIPFLWKVGAAAALVVALGAAHAYRVSAAYDAGHAAAVDKRAAADLGAVVARVQDNAVVAAKQETDNRFITKVKNEELSPVVQRIYVDRVRVGTALCNGPAGPAQAEGATGGNSADSSGRLVRDDVERDLKALMVAVEQDLATGRACQAFIQVNGMVP